MKTSFVALDALLHQSERFDAAVLDRIAADYPADTDVLLHLVHLAESGEARAQIAGTGLLKRYQERGAKFSSAVVARLLDLLSSAQHWEAALHLLQMLPHLPMIPLSQADALCDSLRDLARHSNKFVRAWAYGGLHRLAQLYPEYRGEISPLLDEAAHREPASVRARLRQLGPLTCESHESKRKA